MKWYLESYTTNHALDYALGGTQEDVKPSVAHKLKPYGIFLLGFDIVPDLTPKFGKFVQE